MHESLLRELEISGDGDTDADGLFTVQKVACLGCCTLAPVLQIDGVTYGHLKPQDIGGVLRDFLALEKAAPAARKAPSRLAAPLGEIRVGLGSCCIAKGSGKVYEALVAAVEHLGASATVKRVGCVGICHQTPLVEVVVPGQPPVLYAQVTSQDAAALVKRHFRPPGTLRRLRHAAGSALEHLLTDEAWESVQRYAIDVRDEPIDAFLGRQEHLATEHCGLLDPLDLQEYVRLEGFAALGRALKEMTPEQVIAEVSASGLRGRGGAGFPTGRKWSLVRQASGQLKYAVCNGDEGDPGAFMDRMLLESYPFRVIEGMIIAAYAVGAGQGIFYIRAEYPLAVRRIEHALEICRREGYLGENILGSGFSLDLRIMQGAGAFICGEETALMESIEGRRGMPRLRPPYPAQSGLWGKPTLINNVETYALAPYILREGPGAFEALGTPKSKGTKVFALAGKAARGGLIEVPMGITLRQIVGEIGGGVGPGRTLKAVQVGGPSGGCVPAELVDTPVDYEALTAAGAIMGSGGLVVLDDRDCMVDIARYFLEFTQDQSCGKCTFCRVGTKRMLEILQRLCEGKGKAADLEELQSLAEVIQQGSLCALGRTAPNPVLSTLKYFRDEYLAHIAGRCPAGRCKTLITYRVTDDCIGCTLCAQVCPADAIAPRPYQKHEIDKEKCTRCDSCRGVCPVSAVVVE